MKKVRGRICLESEMGHGSTFHFTACFGFPTPPQAQSGERDAPEDPGRPSLNILMVGDHLISRTPASKVLPHDGRSVLTAANGVEALWLVERRPFDLILMDPV